MNEIVDKLMFASNEDEELRMRNDVLISVFKDLTFTINAEHDMVRVEIDENKWSEVDTYYNMKKGFLLIVKRTFDKTQNQRWIVDDITDLYISRLVVDNEQIYI